MRLLLIAGVMLVSLTSAANADAAAEEAIKLGYMRCFGSLLGFEQACAVGYAASMGWLRWRDPQPLTADSFCSKNYPHAVAACIDNYRVGQWKARNERGN